MKPIWALTVACAMTLVVLCILSSAFGVATTGTAILALLALIGLYPGVSRLVDRGLERWWPDG